MLLQSILHLTHTTYHTASSQANLHGMISMCEWDRYFSQLVHPMVSCRRLQSSHKEDCMKLLAFMQKPQEALKIYSTISWAARCARWHTTRCEKCTVILCDAVNVFVPVSVQCQSVSFALE